MSRQQIEGHQAQELARENGCFARVGNGGLSLVFYTGDEYSPGTWLEIGKTGMTAAGYVDKNTVEMIVRIRDRIK